MSSTAASAEISDTTIESARTGYAASINDDDHEEFLAAKSALIRLSAGRALTAEEIAYI